jgi:hypothetical protein
MCFLLVYADIAAENSQKILKLVSKKIRKFCPPVLLEHDV